MIFCVQNVSKTDFYYEIVALFNKCRTFTIIPSNIFKNIIYSKLIIINNINLTLIIYAHVLGVVLMYYLTLEKQIDLKLQN